MLNYKKENLVAIDPSTVANKTLAMKVGNEIFLFSNANNQIGASMQYIYFDIPDESQINQDDNLLLDIDFALEDNFSDAVSYTQADCQLFNPATGNWILVPENGINYAMASSKLRLTMPDTNYKNCRYRWKVLGGATGSYITAII